MDFNIVDYLAGLTAYQFDDRVYKTIAMDRGVLEVPSFSAMSQQTKDLLKADILYTAYTAPTTTASISQSHSGFSQSQGAQTMTNREVVYNTIYTIYNKYNDPKLEDLESLEGGMRFIDESEYENAY